MSRKHHEHEHLSDDKFGFDGRKPTFPMLIILILIILQFSGKNFIGIPGGDHHPDGFGVIDNGILFIIALFFLSCGCMSKRDC